MRTNIALCSSRICLAISIAFGLLIDRAAAAPAKIDPSRQHIVVTSDADARKNFVTFTYPVQLAGWHSRGGLHLGFYRLEVSSEGQVTAVEILRSMGHTVDVIMLKQMIHWHARPGGERVIDVGWRFGPKHFRYAKDEAYELLLADPEHIPAYLDNAPHYSGFRNSPERIEEDRLSRGH